MSLSSKILAALLAIVVICAATLVVYFEIQRGKQIDQLNQSITAQEQLANNLIRSSSEYATQQQIADFANQQQISLKTIQDNLDNLNGHIVGIGTTTVISSAQSNTNISSSSISAGQNVPSLVPGQTDPYGYLTNQQNLQLNENFANTQIPFGIASFSAWKDKPWDIQINARNYTITSVLGADHNQKYYTYSKFSIQEGGKNFDIKIDNSKFEQELPASHFSWFNPHLFLNAAYGVNINEAPIKGTPSFGTAVGLMSYGQFDNQPAISILQLGVSYQIETKKPALVLNPIEFNMGKVIPYSIINNTYIGPSIQLNTGGNIFAGINVSVGL